MFFTGIRTDGAYSTPGMPGNLAGNPFSSDFVIPQQKRPATGGPQLNPLQQTPTRVFPKDQPGREGALDVIFRQAAGQGIGNMQGLLNAQFYGGPQLGQVPPGFVNKMVS